MTDFEALKRQAKEREEGVRKVFVNYDHDKSDSIDMMELTCLLDDLGLYEKIKTDKTTFVAEMFAEFDKNGDGVLSFEEFKGVYNRAKDNAAGRKPAPMTRAKTQSGLDSTMETERKRDINDDIVGGVNIGEARKQKAREGEEARQAEEDRYKQSAKDLAAMKKNTAARTDHDLLDDPV